MPPCFYILGNKIWAPELKKMCLAFTTVFYLCNAGRPGSPGELPMTFKTKITTLGGGNTTSLEENVLLVKNTVLTNTTTSIFTTRYWIHRLQKSSSDHNLHKINWSNIRSNIYTNTPIITDLSRPVTTVMSGHWQVCLNFLFCFILQCRQCKVPQWADEMKAPCF